MVLHDNKTVTANQLDDSNSQLKNGFTLLNYDEGQSCTSSHENDRLSMDSDNSNCSNTDTCSLVTSDINDMVLMLGENEDVDEDDEFHVNDGYLEPFLHQVGGHGSVLSWDQRTVCKPFSVQEHQFYEALPVEFKEFVPEYRGTIEVGLIKDNTGYLLLNVDNPSAEGDYKEQTCFSKNGYVLSNTENTTTTVNKTMRKCESSNNVLCKQRKSVGRIKLKRSGSLELDVYRRSGRRNRVLENSEKKCNCDYKYADMFSDFPKKGSFSGSPRVSNLNEKHVDGPATQLCYRQNPWAMECQARQLNKMQRKLGQKQKFILLENLVRNFNLPCILDLKMGFRHYGDDAPMTKQHSQTAKCKNSTSSVLGVRMCGMQVYHADSGIFKCYNKYYGQMLSVDGFKREIFKFWHNGITFRSDLVPQCIEKLKALKQLIIQAEGYRFYSSSLLIIYDGDIYSLSSSPENRQQQPTLLYSDVPSSKPHSLNHTCLDNETSSGRFSNSAHAPLDDKSNNKISTNSVIVRMIDFEHTASPMIGKLSTVTHKGYDRGYVDGIDNLINILNNLSSSIILPDLSVQ